MATKQPPPTKNQPKGVNHSRTATAAQKTKGPPAFVQVPLPGPLKVSGGDTREQFECFEFAWHNYSVASGLSVKPEKVQLFFLTSALGEDAERLLLQLMLSDEQRSTVAGTLDGLRKRLSGSGNMRADRFEFNRALQRPDESYADFFARLRMLVHRCQFGSIAVVEDFLLDRLLVSIRDRQLAHRMASQRSLALQQAIDWCLRHEKQCAQKRRIAEAAVDASAAKDNGSMIADKPTVKKAAAAASSAPCASANSVPPLAVVTNKRLNAAAAIPSAIPSAPAAAAAVQAPEYGNDAPPSYELAMAADASEERGGKAPVAVVAGRMYHNEVTTRQRQLETSEASYAVIQRAVLLQQHIRQIEDMEKRANEQMKAAQYKAADREKDVWRERVRVEQLAVTQTRSHTDLAPVNEGHAQPVDIAEYALPNETQQRKNATTKKNICTLM